MEHIKNFTVGVLAVCLGILLFIQPFYVFQELSGSWGEYHNAGRCVWAWFLGAIIEIVGFSLGVMVYTLGKEIRDDFFK